jgi:putative N6-adenine-specific DNA methylase
LRETLAAALVLASGWDRRSPLVDPFCGSGTIPIEAAMIAARMAPGRNREFRFMHWPGFHAAEWKRAHSAALSRQLASGPPILGSDRSAAPIRAAEDNARRAGVDSFVRFEKSDALQVDGGEVAGWVVTNPPYGVRLGDSDESRRLLGRFGEVLQSRFAGWHVALLAPAPLRRAMRVPLEPRFRTTNGGLRVQLLVGAVTNGQAPSGV